MHKYFLGKVKQRNHHVKKSWIRRK